MKEQKIGRLAMRVEGGEWVAYYAMPESMEGAVRLGAIGLGAVQEPARKEAFMSLMRDAVADIIETKVGVRPTWGAPQAAPEHERSGRA